MSKVTMKQLVERILRDGKVLESQLRGERSYVIVEAYGKRWWIDNPWGKTPRATQLLNVSKN